MNSDVRQSGSTVTAYACAEEGVYTNIEILGRGHTEVGESASAHLGVVLTTCGGRNHERLVGVIAVAEPAAEGADFKVSVLGIVGSLEDEVRGYVV